MDLRPLLLAATRRRLRGIESATNATRTKDRDRKSPPTNLSTSLRQGDISVQAEGTGDGRMTLALTNRTKRPLRVVLPPGLIASGATGQMGGMRAVWAVWAVAWVAEWAAVWAAWAVVWAVAWAVVAGMGGGMGGGMMGGGMGGMGGGMGGGMMGGGTMPSSMGMMMLGRLIMSLVGDRDSWDSSSLMSGMMGGMGGGTMGGGGMMGGGGAVNGRGDAGRRDAVDSPDEPAVRQPQAGPDAEFAHPTGLTLAAHT